MSSQQFSYRRSQDDRSLGYRKLVTAGILIVALVGFECFNFSTTAYALGDLLGQLNFLGLRWSIVLSIAFCSIDFAGIARLLLPENEQQVPRELWFLFGAWLLAATMNAILTWWGISMAVVNRTLTSSAIINPQILTHSVPVFVAILVWVTRILLIGSFSYSIKPATTGATQQEAYASQRPAQQPLIVRRNERTSTVRPQPVTPAHAESILPRSQPLQPAYRSQELEREEPSEPVYVTMDAAYHSLSASSRQKPKQTRRF
jgi:hypothetical protein